MIEAYLKQQCKFLSIMIILIGISLIVGTGFLLHAECVWGAVLHASISTSIILSFFGVIRSNHKYLNNIASIANIERTAFRKDGNNGVQVIEGNVPDLGFKFHRD